MAAGSSLGRKGRSVLPRPKGAKSQRRGWQCPGPKSWSPFKPTRCHQHTAQTSASTLPFCPPSLPRMECVCGCARSCLTLCDPGTLARQAPLSMEFSRRLEDTGVGCHFLLQGIFLTQRLNPCSHIKSEAVAQHVLICQLLWSGGLCKSCLYSWQMAKMC